MNTLSSIALSGLSAATLRIEVSAGNIANAATAGQRRQFVLQTARSGGGVDTALAQASEAGTDLAQDVVEQMGATYAFKANLRVIDTHDRLLGALLNLRA